MSEPGGSLLGELIACLRRGSLRLQHTLLSQGLAYQPLAPSYGPSLPGRPLCLLMPPLPLVSRPEGDIYLGEEGALRCRSVTWPLRGPPPTRGLATAPFCQAFSMCELCLAVVLSRRARLRPTEAGTLLLGKRTPLLV